MLLLATVSRVRGAASRLLSGYSEIQDAATQLLLLPVRFCFERAFIHPVIVD
jgi:hypothetical protein